MKSIIATVVIFIAALASVTFAASGIYGKRNNTDILLLREIVIKAPIKNGYQSVIVEFPKSGQGNTRIISAVYVYDRFTNSSGAYPSLWSGGPGYKFATINLKSQYNRGINSTVEIYGKK